VRHRTQGPVVVLGGRTPEGSAAVAASTNGSADAVALVRLAAPLIGGGGGGTSELALAGGRRADGVDEALDAVRAQLNGA